MDVELLHSYFAGTLESNINTRRQAELHLKNIEKTPGFITACLNLVLAEQASSVHKAAAIYLKNRVKNGWFDPKTEVEYKITEEEKPIFREQIVPALVRSSPTIRTQLIGVISHIIDNDYPTSWPTFLELTLNLLTSGDLPSTYAGVICFMEVCRAYTWKSHSDKEGFDHVVSTLFPTALDLAKSLVNETSTQAAEMLHHILKGFKFSIILDLSKHLQQQDVLVAWGTLFFQVITKDLPQEAMLPDLEERALHPWWKCKKWAFYILSRIFTRYGNPANLAYRAEYKPFANSFSSSFVPEIFNVYTQQVELWAQKKVWLPKKCIFHILSFYEGLTEKKSNWALLQPHVETFLSHVIFPLLCPTDEDLALFEDEPEEYIRQRIDVFDECPTSDIAATNLLRQMATKRRKSTFDLIIQFVNEVMTYTQQGDKNDIEIARKKEGALRMIGSISDVVLGSKSPVKNLMESFFANFVFPDFDSSFGFLRARACEIVNQYAEIEYSSPENIQFVYQKVLKCLEDKDLPVQIEAALALQPMVSHPIVKQDLSGKITFVMQKLLELSKKTDSDSLSGVMAEFVEAFSTELTPFAVQLTEQLCDQLLRILSESVESNKNVNSDNIDFDPVEEEKMSACLGLMNTLSTLLLTLENSPEVMAKLEELLYPVIVKIFEGELIDLYSEVFDLIGTELFCLKVVSPHMWNLFSLIHASIKSTAIEFIEEATPVITSIIMYGVSDMVAHPDLINAVVDIINVILSDAKRTSIYDNEYVANIAHTLILSIPAPHLDHVIPVLLNLSLWKIKDEEKVPSIKSYTLSLLNIILASFYYNPIDTLTFLDQNSMTSAVFTLWLESMQSLYIRVYDKKLAILAILRLITIENSQIIGNISSIITQLFHGEMYLLKTLPDAIKKKEELLKEYETPTNDDLYASWDPDTDYVSDEEEETQEEADDKYTDSLIKEAKRLAAAEDDEDDLDEELEENALDDTPLDNINAYISFRNAMNKLSQDNADRYQMLFSTLSPEELEVVKETNAKATADEQSVSSA